MNLQAAGRAGRLRRRVGLMRSMLIYWRPGRQRGLRRLYAQFVRHGDLVFDVGAHLGDRTAAFSSLGAQVVALEPQPQLHSLLRWLVGRRPRVTLLAQAVGNQSGTAELAISQATPTVSTLAGHWRRHIGRANASFRDVRWEERVTVPVVTLDQLIDQYGVPAFCKIDVEGFEAEVLAGLRQPIPALSVEFVAGMLTVAMACVKRIEALGAYEFNVIKGEGRDFAFQDWRTPERMLQWLMDGAEAASSGDVYARLA